MVSGKRNQRLSLSRICIQDCGYQTYSQVLWLPGQLHPRAQAQGQGRPQFLGAFIPGVRAASQADPWWPGWPGSSRVFPAVTGSGPYIRIQEISPLCPQAERGTASCVIHPLLPLGPMPPRHLMPSCLSSGFPSMAPACCWDSRTAGLEVRGLSSPFNPLPQPPQQGQACSPCWASFCRILFL